MNEKINEQENNEFIDITIKIPKILISALETMSKIIGLSQEELITDFLIKDIEFLYEDFPEWILFQCKTSQKSKSKFFNNLRKALEQWDKIKEVKL